MAGLKGQKRSKPRRMRLESVAAVRRRTAEILAELRADKMQPDKARAAFTGLRLALDCIRATHIDDFEARLAELEARYKEEE